jgi:hypothetical protein
LMLGSGRAEIPLLIERHGHVRTVAVKIDVVKTEAGTELAPSETASP